MNTISKSPNLHRMIASVAFGGLMLSFSAICPAADGAGLPQATVKYGDLNVSSPQGAAALYARIRVAADGVCRSLDGRGFASILYSRCVHKAIADAVTNVDQPALNTVYNMKNSTPKPIMLVSAQNH
jgi:UrcA family protein